MRSLAPAPSVPEALANRLGIPMLIFAVALFAGSAPAVELPGMSTVTALIMEFDGNGDGLIDQREFQAGVAGGFTEMDKDEDGRITEAEIAGLRGPLSETAGDLAASAAVLLIKAVLLTLDKDGDKVVSRAEYTKGSEDVFARLDANQDGKVSKAEVEDLPGRLLGKPR